MLPYLPNSCCFLFQPSLLFCDVIGFRGVWRISDVSVDTSGYVRKKSKEKWSVRVFTTLGLVLKTHQGADFIFHRTNKVMRWMGKMEVIIMRNFLKIMTKYLKIMRNYHKKMTWCLKNSNPPLTTTTTTTNNNEILPRNDLLVLIDISSKLFWDTLSLFWDISFLFFFENK